MAGIYSRFGNQSPERIRNLILGTQSNEELTTADSNGIMSRAPQPAGQVRSRFSGVASPVSLTKSDSSDTGSSFLETFFILLGNSADDPEAVANAVAPMRGEPAVDLSDWESMPPAPGAESETRQALGWIERANNATGSTPLLDFIASGEGDYNSSNRGTIGSRIIGSTNQTTRNNRPLTEMTIGQIKELQSISNPNNPNRLFAVGRYQVIPDTLQEAVRDLNLPDDAVFNQETQDRIGMWLINEKRPAVGAFLSGADVPIDEAMMSLAKEFASVPVPYDTVDTRGRRIRAGQSFYHHFGGNRAGHSIEETRNILRQGRELFDSQRPEGALAPLASLTPQPNPSR